jgi:hypothetical protein
MQISAHGGSIGRHGGSTGRHGGSMVSRQTVFLQSQVQIWSPNPTVNCQSPDGLLPGMALGFELTSVRGNRKEKLQKMSRWFAKKKKKNQILLCFYTYSSII